MPTLFDRAAAVFPGWTDRDTGLRVLRVQSRGDAPADVVWVTRYHQSPCFLEGGRKILLSWRRHPTPAVENRSFLLDLTTGQVEYPFPAGTGVQEVWEPTGLASLSQTTAAGATRVLLWDLKTRREVAGLTVPEGWTFNSLNLLPGKRAGLVFIYRGQYYTEPVYSQHILLTPGEEPRVVMEADGFFCSHIQGCPTDPELYAYDRWPSPKRDIDQAIHLRTLDGRYNEPLPLAPEAMRPGDMWGARDHYLWTPDGRYIVSYFAPKPIGTGPGEQLPEAFNHFTFGWWLSVLDRHTGQDLAACYPAGRWGGHMAVSPDSRAIVCGGGPGFDKLFTVDIDGLRQGWNERVLCSYPHTVSQGKNHEPFPYPFVLPDQSGVIFNAGWPGPEHGVYLVEWPRG